MTRWSGQEALAGYLRPTVGWLAMDVGHAQQGAPDCVTPPRKRSPHFPTGQSGGRPRIEAEALLLQGSPPARCR